VRTTAVATGEAAARRQVRPGGRELVAPGSPGPRVLAVFGPTASGKSAVAEALAARIPAQLVVADSAQLYRGLPILTNQSPAQLVGVWTLDHEASVAEYAELAHAAVDAALAAERTPVVVGGTGLYFRAALAELDVPPAVGPAARERWQRYYDRRGGETAHALLARRDPDAAAAVHPNDRRRVVRALELGEAGRSLAGGRLWTGETRHTTLVVGLEVPVDELARRIEERTRAMFDRGVEAEVRLALEQQLSTTALKIMGLREVAELPREAATQALAARTRRLAAYQRKWMRRIPGLVTVRADRSSDEVADDILALARGGQRVPAGRAG
jgi:tRNA dimethylallyltransferase